MKGYYFKRTKGILIVKAMIWLLTPLLILIIPACGQGSYVNVASGSVEHETKFDGIVVRSERLYTAPVSGRILYHKGEEQRVKKEGQIMTIVTQHQDGQFYEELRKITQEITAYEEENIAGPILRKDLEVIDKRTLRETDSLRTANNNGDTGAADRAIKRLRQLYDKREELLARVHAKTPYIEQLYNQKLEMEETLQQSALHIAAPVTGIVGYCHDGLEVMLGRECLEHLTADQLMGLQPQGSTRTDYAAYGQPLYKIIEDHEWYVVILKESGKPPFFDKSQSYRMKIFQLDGKILDTKVYNIIRDKGYEIIIFSIDQQARDYTKIRNIDFSIISSIEGLKLPIESIYNIKEKDYVKLMSKDAWDWVEVDVLARDQSSVIIKEDMITLHDRVLINE